MTSTTLKSAGTRVSTRPAARKVAARRERRGESLRPKTRPPRYRCSVPRLPSNRQWLNARVPTATLRASEEEGQESLEFYHGTNRAVDHNCAIYSVSDCAGTPTHSLPSVASPRSSASHTVCGRADAGNCPVTRRLSAGPMLRGEPSGPCSVASSKSWRVMIPTTQWS